MIAVDTSALIAILLGEPERDRFIAAIVDADHAVILAATVIEARMVAYGRGGAAMVAALDALIDGFGLTIVPLGDTEIPVAHAAFVTYGKGNGHPASLNFGDVFSYALAKSRGVPLLFKGNDFALTDVAVSAGGT